MKNNKSKITAIFLSVLLIALLLPYSTARAEGNITLTVSASNTSIEVGDEVAITVRMSDAAMTDFCSFSFRINLPEGLTYKSGSGSIVLGFLSATGMSVSVFDEEPFLFASGFGDAPYNGGPLDVAIFTCTATSSGQKTVNLSNVKVFDTSAKAIPNSVVRASIEVISESQNREELPSQQLPGAESSAIDNPASGNPIAGSPAVENPAIENPAVENPAVENPAIGNTAPGDPVVWNNPFTDISSDYWYFDDIAWAHSNGIMSGTEGDRFDPQILVTRAMLVTVIYRLAGSPSYTNSVEFSDVEKGIWYSDAVAWASENSIVKGIGSAKFAPNDNITREQISAILFRYANFTKASTFMRGDVSGFVDDRQISDYALVAVSWAVASKIITGRPGGVLEPRAPATRAEVAAMLHRFAEG